MVWTLGAFAFLPSAQAQNVNAAPIRVESNDVRVPVIVLDRARLNEIHRMNPHTFVDQVNAAGSDLIEGVFVRGLSATDFEVFEDGIQQKIERVTFQISPAWGQKSGRPNAAFGFGTVAVEMPAWPRYLVAYMLPPSPEGSCHNISVKADRPGVLVYSQHLYCNRTDWFDDPLGGTKLGHEMQAELDTGKAGKVKLSLSAFPHLATGPVSTVDVILAFPAAWRWLSDCNKPPPIGYLGVAYGTTSGTVAARFSGLLAGDLNNALGQTNPILLPTESNSCLIGLPSTPFEAQIRLAPGDYELKLLLRNGENFGRAEIPVSVRKTDPEHLAISQIVLGKESQKISASEDDAHGKYEPLVSNGFEIIPTANPRFEKGGPFYFYLEVYDPAQSGISAQNSEVQLRILDPKTRRVVKSLNPLSVANYAKPGDPIIPIGGGIDITALSTGSYVLEAQANDSAGNSTPWRTANFAIEK